MPQCPIAGDANANPNRNRNPNRKMWLLANGKKSKTVELDITWALVYSEYGLSVVTTHMGPADLN